MTGLCHPTEQRIGLETVTGLVTGRAEGAAPRELHAHLRRKVLPQRGRGATRVAMLETVEWLPELVFPRPPPVAGRGLLCSRDWNKVRCVFLGRCLFLFPPSLDSCLLIKGVAPEGAVWVKGSVFASWGAPPFPLGPQTG